MDGSLPTAFIDTKLRSDERAAWLRARRTGIGASEAGALFGEHRWLTLGRLVAQKRGLLEDDAGETERLAWGLRHEPTILAAYSSPTYANRPAKRDGRLLRSVTHSWALATLDAWTEHPVHGAIPLELKSAESWMADEWTDGPPPTYWWQAQHQMLVTDKPCCSIACLLGPHRLVWDDVERDETMIRRLIKAGADAWALIQSDAPPPGPHEREVFLAFWPNEEKGRVVQLDETIARLDAEREELAVTLAAAKARKEAIDAEILDALRGAELGVLPGERVSYSLKAQTRKAHQVKESTTRVLRRHEKKAKGDTEA